MIKKATPEEIAQLVEDHRLRARDAEADLKESFYVWEAQYFLKYLNEQLGDTSAQSPKTKSSQFVGYAHSQIETAVSRFMSILFRRDQPFEVEPTGGYSVQDASAVAALHMHSIRVTNFRRMMRQALRFLFIYGVAPLKTVWVDKWQRKGDLVPVRKTKEDGTVYWEYEEAEKDMLLYGGPETFVIDPYLFHIEPGADSVESAAWVQEEFVKSREYVEEMIKQGVYDEVDLDKISPHTETSSGHFDYLQRRKELMGTPTTQTGDHDGDKIVSPRYDIVEEHHDDMVYTVIGMGKEAKLIRSRPNPYAHKRKPYVALRYIDIANEFWGLPMSRQVEGPQSELNLIRRLRSDSLLATLKNMWRVSPSVAVGLDDNQLEFRPNGIIEAEKDEIEPLKRDVLPIFGYKEEDILRLDGDMITGVTDIFRGQGAASQTATGGTMNANFSTDRLALILDGVSDELSNVFDQRHKLYQQYITQEQIVKSIGEEGVKPIIVAPEHIAGDYSFHFRTGRDVTQRELYRNQYMQALTVAAQNPVIAQLTNFELLLRDFWATFDMPNPGKYVLSPTTMGMSQQAEIMVMALGEPVHVKPGDNHVEHMQFLQQFVTMPEFMQIPEQGKAFIMQHMSEHMPYFQQQMAIQGQPKGLSSPERANVNATAETEGEVLADNERFIAPKVRT